MTPRLLAHAVTALSRSRSVLHNPIMRQSLIRIAARIASSGMQAVMLILLARALGPSDFGRFAVGLSFGYVVSALLAWGGSTRVLRASAEKLPDELRSSLALIQVAGLALLLASAVVLALLGQVDISSTAGFALGLSDQLNVFGQNEAAGRSAHSRASLLSVQQRAFPAVAMLTMLGRFEWPVLLTSIAIASIAPLGSALRAIRRAPSSRSTLRGGTGYWTYGLIQASPQLEAPVVNAVADAAVAGLYGIANRVATPLTILSSALASIFIPEIASAPSPQRRRELGRRLVLISSCYAFLVAVSALWIAPLVVAIVGEQFKSAQSLIAATTVAAGLSAVSQAVNAVLLAAGRPFASTWILGVGTVVSLIGLATFSSLADAQLLWLAPLITQVVVLVLFLVVARRGSGSAGASADESRVSELEGPIQAVAPR